MSKIRAIRIKVVKNKRYFKKFKTFEESGKYSGKFNVN